MSKFILKLFLIFYLALNLYAEGGFNQKHLVSVSPENAAEFVANDTAIEIDFDLNINKNSIKKQTITVKNKIPNAKNIKINGNITVKDKRTLVFSPYTSLDDGLYHVKVQKIKLLDFSDNNPTRFKKFARKVCSYYYDDITKCFLYRYACSTTTKAIKYSFNVGDIEPKVVSLTLNKSNFQLNDNNHTDINVNATYDDNSSLDVTESVEWIMSDDSVISIDKNIITPINEGKTSLQAKFDGQVSQQIEITVYRAINGYKLPPEPDETLNNATLLGIDSNNNGVRDDVERKVILTYREPIKVEPLMATVKIGQEILENPIGLAKEHSVKMDRVGDCWSYISEVAPELIDELGNVKFYEKNMYNTEERIRAYLDYNRELSGGVYGSGPADWTADKCDFDVEQLLKDI